MTLKQPSGLMLRQQQELRYLSRLWVLTDTGIHGYGYRSLKTSLNHTQSTKHTTEEVPFGRVSFGNHLQRKCKGHRGGPVGHAGQYILAGISRRDGSWTPVMIPME